MAAKKSAAKSKSSTKEVKLTPIQKALAARAANKLARDKAAKSGKKVKAAPAKTSGRVALPLWKAPEDFKPFFLEVSVNTEKDGLLGTAIRCVRYQGRYDENAPDNKKANLNHYDHATVIGVMSRFAAVTYVTNAHKRLPASTSFKILLRVNRKAKDGSISVLFKGMWIAAKSKTGRVKAKALDKSDFNYRKFRKAARILPAAFKNVLPMPNLRAKRSKATDDDE